MLHSGESHALRAAAVVVTIGRGLRELACIGAWAPQPRPGLAPQDRAATCVAGPL